MNYASYEPNEKTLAALDDLRARISGGETGQRFLQTDQIQAYYGIRPLSVCWILDRLREESLIETRMGVGSRVVTQAGPLWSKVPKGLTAVEFIGRTVRLRIAVGVYAVGSRLPSVDVLGVEFGFCAMTVATALRPLRREGLIEYRRGLGSFVLANPARKEHSTGKAK
ncbi:GntR family transcriptional regulator [Streptomyces sp. NPDC087851]|uniref:GntR family transcriptional regulator n=1 Tax=Streptomyces sp. NPDC087851 TaxID=3365810 RepID=UPI003811ABA8